MPDISMCSTKVCPRRSECWRAVAPESTNQWWGDFYELGVKCDKFIDARRFVNGRS